MLSRGKAYRFSGLATLRKILLDICRHLRMILAHGHELDSKNKPVHETHLRSLLNPITEVIDGRRARADESGRWEAVLALAD